MRRTRMSMLIGAAVVCVLTGCHHPPAAPFETFSVRSASAETAGDPTFAAYVLAAKQAASAEPKLTERIRLLPSEERKLGLQLDPAIATIVARAGKVGVLPKRPTSPSEARPQLRAWALILRGITDKLDRSIHEGKLDDVVRLTVAGTQFAVALTGGCMEDASVGFAGIDSIRRTVLPHLPTMGAGQLNQLSQGLEVALRSRPNPSLTLDQELAQMLECVDFIQDKFARQKEDDLVEQLGTGAEEAVRALKEIRGKSDTERVAYFRELADDARRRTDRVRKLLDVRAADRKREKDPNRKKPWAFFARNFFGAIDQLPALQDRFLARTRLFALQARIYSRIKVDRRAPANIASISDVLRIDPYTGKTLNYRAAGVDFQLYSAGEDGKDDGGTTDAEGLSPDIVLR